MGLSLFFHFRSLRSTDLHTWCSSFITDRSIKDFYVLKTPLLVMSRYFAVAMNGSHETKGLLFLLGLTKNNFLIHRIYSGSITFVFIVPFSTKKSLFFIYIC